jgi:hypothetical protein
MMYRRRELLSIRNSSSLDRSIITFRVRRVVVPARPRLPMQIADLTYSTQYLCYRLAYVVTAVPTVDDRPRTAVRAGRSQMESSQQIFRRKAGH